MSYRDDAPKEACAWVPGTRPLQMVQVVTNLQLYMAAHDEGGIRKPGDPHITGYRVLDDRGGTGHFQVRVGLKAPQLKRLVPKDIDVTMEYT